MDELKFSQKEAFLKAMKYCAYQERCHAEVRNKLYTIGLQGDDLEEVIMVLIQENFLNEERYASAFARGRFRLKKWGRLKIERSLQEKEVSPYCIQPALAEIDEEEYEKCLTGILTSKDEEVRKRGKWSDFDRRGKLASFCINKGYEPELVWKLILRHF